MAGFGGSLDTSWDVGSRTNRCVSMGLGGVLDGRHNNTCLPSSVVKSNPDNPDESSV